MKLRLLASSLLAAGIAVSAAAQEPWLHIYRSDRRFHTVPLDSVASLTITPDTGSDAASQIMLALSGDTKILVPAKEFDHMIIGGTVPSVHITTADPDFKDVYDKTTEWDAVLSVESHGFPGMEDIDGQELKLRGRGNSTLGFPKKPYRLKAKKKFAMHSDLLKAKNYVLLANWIDNTLMRNSAAFKTAQLLGLPYTPHGVPCNVWINGIYRGSYLLCEKTGLNAGNIHDIEETEGILLELDTNVDPSDTYLEDEWGNKYIDPFHFPVAIKDPDFGELEEDGLIPSASDAIAAWHEKYCDMANTLAGNTGKDWTDLIDLESAVRYVMTFHLCGNLELRHPKSCLMRARTIDSKFEFGPVWDFDWAFTYGDGGEGSQQPTATPFGGENTFKPGAQFFLPIVSDERFQKRFGEVWADFCSEGLPQLFEWMEDYAATIEPTAASNLELGYQGFQSPADFREAVTGLRRWISRRADFISTAPNFGLYDSRPDYGAGEAPEGFTAVNLTPGMLSPSDPDMLEGQIENLIDGNPLTFYHSDWHSIERHDPVYGSYVDITLPEEATSIVFDMTSRTHAQHLGTPDYVWILVSDDGEEWTELASAGSLIKNAFEKPGDSARIGAFTAPEPFRNVRFAVLASGVGDLRSNTVPDNVPPQFHKLYYTYWNLAELSVYTK